MRDAVIDVAHDSGEFTRRDGLTHVSLCAGTYFPNQPNHSPGAAESDSLELLVGRDPMPTRVERHILGRECGLSMRIAALRELQTNAVVEKPTMESIVEFNGRRIDDMQYASVQQYIRGS